MPTFYLACGSINFDAPAVGGTGSLLEALEFASGKYIARGYRRPVDPRQGLTDGGQTNVNAGNIFREIPVGVSPLASGYPLVKLCGVGREICG